MSTVNTIDLQTTVPFKVSKQEQTKDIHTTDVSSKATATDEVTTPPYVVEISETGRNLWKNNEEKELVDRYAKDSKVSPQLPPAKPRYAERMNLVDDPEKCYQWVCSLLRERQYGGTVAELAEPVTLTTDSGNELKFYTQKDEKTGLNRLFLNITENTGNSFEVEVSSNLLLREGDDGKLYFTTDISKTSEYTDIVINLTGDSIDTKGGDDFILNLRNPAKAEVNHVKINGGDGNDTIVNGNSSFTDIDGGKGNDTIIADTARSLNISGGDGDDTFIAKTILSSVIAMGSGKDLINITDPAEAIKEIVDGKRTTRSEESAVESGFEMIFYNRTDSYGNNEYRTSDIQDSTQLTLIVDGKTIKEPSSNLSN